MKKVQPYKSGLNLKPKQSFKSQYDVIIDVDSICKPNDSSWKGWSIYTNKNWDESILKKKFNEKTKVVGIVGHENKGKTWLIEKLTFQ